MKKCLLMVTLLLSLLAPMALMADGNPNGPPPPTQMPNPTSMPVGR